MKRFILCVMLAGVAIVHAAPDNGAHNAIHLLFNGQIDAADSVLTLGMKNSPQNPEFFFLKAQYAFYMRYFSPTPVGRDSMLNIIVSYGEKAVEIGKKAQQTIDTKFYIGSAYGLLSRAYIMQGKLWEGYWAASDCENFLEDVLDEDPGYADAKIGLGVLEYYPSRLNGFQAFIAWAGGFGGNAEKGLAYFEEASKNGNLLKTEADFILATLNRFIIVDFNKADNYFARLNQHYPGNNWIANQYHQTQLAHTIDADGVDFFIAAFDSLRSVYNINTSNI
ncbi:hypothetical protein KC799_14705, partial [candidate division KSB1 bacterium]|nr:hypothetical protein [candidate division KSB1 bacterium]